MLRAIRGLSHRFRGEAPRQGFLRVLVLFAVLIVVLGYALFQFGAHQLTEYQWRVLESHASERQREINFWMERRQFEARRFLETPDYRRAVEALLDGNATAAVRAELDQESDFLLARGNYEGIVLLDRQGGARYSKGGEVADRATTETLMTEAMAGGGIIFRDIAEPADEGFEARILMAAPVFEEGVPRGALIFRLQPYLYSSPLVEEWPALQSSAEVLVFREEQGQLLYLTQPRFLDIEATPVSPGLIGAQIVAGREGRVEGVDYRGVATIAVGRAIPGTPWFLAAKVDRAEVVEVVRRLALGVTALMLLLLAVGGVAARNAWQRQSAERRASEYKASMDRQALAAHFDYLAKYANDIIVLADEGGRIVEVNDRAVESYGYSREELQRMNIRELRTPAEDERLTRELPRVKERVSTVIESVHRRGDGRTFPVEISARLIPVKERIYYQEIIRDITERKEAEEALRESEERLRLIAETIEDVFWISSPGIGRMLYVSPAYERIWGRSRDSLYRSPHSFQEAVHPDDLPFVRQVFTEYHAGGRPYEMEYRIATDRGVRWIRERGYPVRGKSGELVAMTGVCTDVTERKQAEETLRAAIAYNRSLIEASLDPLVTIGPTGLITDVNRATEAVTGLSRGELIGTDFSDYFTEPERARAGYEQVFREGWVRDYPLELRHRDGHTTSVLYNATVYRDAAGEVAGVFAAARDITARKRAEQELRALNEELQRTLRELRASQEQVIQTEKIAALGTMAAGVAHELNNPLMGVMNYVGYARSHPERPDAGERLLAAEQELERMRRLLRGMLAFARPVEGRPSRVSIPKVLERTVELMRADLRARGIEVEVRIDGDALEVMAKPDRLQQVFMNLLLNARDAVRDSPEKRVAIRAWREGEDVWIEFADSGPGVPAHVKDRIFDPFFTTKAPGEGTGMGLPVSRNIVTDLGGELTMKSEEGRGACFYVRLKAAADSQGG